jgi:bifunctional DNA-binding transcriptional regulator/antitoxin component of YhaV-PrlF toxin-antitoxin module
MDGEVTKLTRANNKSKSLRTTVPMSIVRRFDLREGDKLLWRFEAINNKLVIVIQPLKLIEVESG